jgi:hypothetical protein
MRNSLSIQSLPAIISLALLLASCGGDHQNDNSGAGPALFEKVAPAASGIDFINQIVNTKDINYLNFTYLYMSGGAGVGDFNNDGLPDVYFGATMGPNKLYLNKGNFQFEDISARAGITAPDGIKTGVTVIDVNGDGFLDIYQCRTGPTPESRGNILFINNGNLTFTDRANEYGLNPGCASTHANFFDYDLDGDLDMYLINHPTDFANVSQLRISEVGGKIVRTTTPDNEYTSDRLYRNDNGKFTDVSKSAGIDNYAFGLSATVMDANLDGYPDVYVANDYVVPDFLYINNKNGTFTDRINDYVRHLSHFSMGTDLADINNDGLLDLFVLDMANPTNYKDKTNSTAMRNERYYTLAQYGYGEQMMRNVLQLNNGNGTFSEIGCLSGVSATDWSWSPLMVDFDNDGWKDIYISNGFRAEVQNLDFVTFEIDSTLRADGGKFRDTLAHIQRTPQVPIHNFVYRNRGDLTFEDVTKAWGVNQETFSNAAVYADFDNDGDQDVMVVRCEEPAALYRNKTVESGSGNWLQIKLEGPKGNAAGIGTFVRAIAGGNEMVHFANPIRGFISTSTDIIQYGLGKSGAVERLEVQWPDGKVQKLENITSNQRITLKYTDATRGPSILKMAYDGKPVFRELSSQQTGLTFSHQENPFFDFDRERLIPHKYSNLGPALAVGDINGDGLDDLYVGSGFGGRRHLCIQTASGKFNVTDKYFLQDSLREDVAAAIFDADGDNDNDLFVVSGGNEPRVNSDYYTDRLYLNDGKGNMTSAQANIPAETESGGCVTPFDYDRDGDLDLFIGGRTVPENYPKKPFSFVWQNNGGKFTNVTNTVAPSFGQAGMVTDIEFADLDRDGNAEMIVCGEWMSIEIFRNNGGKFESATSAFGLDQVKGWWNTVVAADMDGDGDMDLVAGNEGLNTRYRASAAEPVRLYAKDFDANGSMDPILSWYWDGVEVPFALRDPLLKQIPALKKKFVHYHEYGNAGIGDLFKPEFLKSGIVLEANELRSCYLENNNGKFVVVPLCNQAQISPVKDIIIRDFNNDGRPDMLLAGNDYGPAVEINRYDAGNGTLLLNQGGGNFVYSPNSRNGFWATREARHLGLVRMSEGRSGVVVANNLSQPQLFVIQ